MALLSRADISQAWGTQSSVLLTLSHAHPGLSPPTQNSHENGLIAGFRSWTGRLGVTEELSNELGMAQGAFLPGVSLVPVSGTFPLSASPHRCGMPVLPPASPPATVLSHACPP